MSFSQKKSPGAFQRRGRGNLMDMKKPARGGLYRNGIGYKTQVATVAIDLLAGYISDRRLIGTKLPAAFFSEIA